MNEAQVLEWFAATWLGGFTRDTLWAFPALEIMHFIGLCTMLGALLVIDLRVLGIGKPLPLAAVQAFIPLAVAGFALNLVSGLAFFCSDPGNYWFNPAFHWKMYLVIFGGLNALAFELLERRKLAALPVDAEADVAAKAIAATSLITWVGVMVLGRLLPYTGAGLG